MRLSFEEAAVRANSNPNITQKVSWKSVQDGYTKLEAACAKCDTVMRSKAGVSEDFSEQDELLFEMRKARANVEASKVAVKAAERERKKREDTSGAFVMEKALKRRSVPDLDVSICKKDGEHDEERV